MKKFFFTATILFLALGAAAALVSHAEDLRMIIPKYLDFSF